VRVMQREGCWVRETKQTFRGATEDIGPCTRAPPEWADDRLTRLVQECVAQADHRWQVHAIAAWNRREPLPPQRPEPELIEACMSEAAATVITQNETLKQRLVEVSGDRETLRADAAQTQEHLRTANERLAGFLGEAAKRPPPVATATATATSDGTAVTETGLQSDTGVRSSALPAILAPPPATPASSQPITALPPSAPSGPLAPSAPSEPDGAASPTPAPAGGAQADAAPPPALARRKTEPPAAKTLHQARTARKRTDVRSVAAPTTCEVPAPCRLDPEPAAPSSEARSPAQEAARGD
jgi:hypothetical protein